MSTQWQQEFFSKPCNCKTCNHTLNYQCGEGCKCCATSKMCPCQTKEADGQ